MGIHFERPWFLLLLIGFAIWFTWAWRNDHRLVGWRKKFVYAIRSCLIIALILALSGLNMIAHTLKEHIIYVVDRSDSVGEHDAVALWIEMAEMNKPAYATSSVISFAEKAAVEQRATQNSLDHVQFRTRLQTSSTDIEAGLKLAQSLLQPDERGRIVLITDGRETIGDMKWQSEILRARETVIDVLPLHTEPSFDVAVDRLRVSQRARIGENVTVEVSVQSTDHAQGVLRLFENDVEIAVSPVELQRGLNRFLYEINARETGHKRFRAEVYADGDARPENDRAFAYQHVVGPAKVLIVANDEQKGAHMSSLLSVGGIETEIVLPEQLSTKADAYLSYKGIVIDDVPASRFTESQMLTIEQAVQNDGLGLLMVGGSNSFGMGDYFDTPLERALPVYMDLRGKRQMPSVALILVLDKSSSMSGEAIRLAQQSAIHTKNLLREDDQLGVVAFDTDPWWIVEPAPIDEQNDIDEKILGIQADGGTNIFTALEAAYLKLSEVEAERKHIILLTDGHSANERSYDRLLAELTSGDMTLSTIAIGEQADHRLLERLAVQGGGRYYLSHNEQQLPAIFSAETRSIARTYIVENPFVPTVVNGVDWHHHFVETIPQVDAYVATTAKDTAEVILMSPETDPLLARWQFGAGKSVAWTSDWHGIWTAAWMKWEGTSALLNELVKWTFSSFDEAPVHLHSRMEGNEWVLQVNHMQADWQGAIDVEITDGATINKHVSLTPVSPGQFEVKLPLLDSGAYVARVQFTPADERGAVQGSYEQWTTGITIPYSAEYKLSIDQSYEHILEEIALQSGGRALTLERPQQLFDREIQPIRTEKSMESLLVFVAILLWPVDIAMRRLQLQPVSIFSRFYNWQHSSEFDPASESVKSDDSPACSFKRSPVTKTKKVLQVEWDNVQVEQTENNNVQKENKERDVTKTEDADRKIDDLEARMQRLLAAKKRRR